MICENPNDDGETLGIETVISIALSMKSDVSARSPFSAFYSFFWQYLFVFVYSDGKIMEEAKRK